MGLFSKPIQIPSGPRELAVDEVDAPGEVFSVPKGYEFESVQVSELDGRQYVDVVLKVVPPSMPVTARRA